MELHSSLDIDRVRYCPSGTCAADSKQMHYKIPPFYLTLQGPPELGRIAFGKVSLSFSLIKHLWYIHRRLGKALLTWRIH